MPAKFSFDEEAHLYKLGGIALPHVTGIIDEMVTRGKYPAGPHRTIGKQVHKATEIYDRGEADNYEFGPVIQGYLASYIRTYTDLPFVWTGIEVRDYDKTLMVAGTTDRIGMLRGLPAIADLKTGTLDQTATALQTAGYAHIHFPGDARRVLRFGIELDKDGGDPRIYRFDDPYDIDGWIGIAKHYTWLQRRQRRVA